MNYKPILSSRTFWKAIIQGVLGVLIVVADIQPDLGKVVIIISILDAVLRMSTTQPVKI